MNPDTIELSNLTKSFEYVKFSNQIDYIKVKGHDHLIRDPKTNSIININVSEYNEYISRRDSKLKESQKIQNLESDVTNMKEDLDEIKFLLRRLINES